jgi:HlyD family secretion protein
LVCSLLGLAGVVGLLGLAVLAWVRLRPEGRLHQLPRSVATRTDLHTRISAGGQIESGDKTLIECELESISLSSGGRTLTARGSSQIIELVPEGTEVRKDDVLCRLDSSEFDEMVRQQEIKVQEAVAERQKAIYDLKAAEMALREYREGTLDQRRQDIEGRKTLAESDISRQRDRLAWAERMVKNNYMAESQLIMERESLLRCEVTLRKVLGEKRHLENFEVIANMARFDSTVNRARSELTYQNLRLRRREQQLEKFKEQVDRCTIRAPHDGFLIYANEANNIPRIELGSIVYQKMDLFYLPNFNDMEVQTVLNESFIGKVSAGMVTQVRVEALRSGLLEGHVVSISPLPQTQKGWRAGNDVRNFIAKVKLHNIPAGVMPGMTAEVEIITAHHPQALVIPSSAVKVEAGQEICYVPLGDSLERRPVDVEPATPDLVEVTSGLEEGEEVISDPYQIDESIPVVDRTKTPAPSGSRGPVLPGQPVAWEILTNETPAIASGPRRPKFH